MVNTYVKVASESLYRPLSPGYCTGVVTQADVIQALERNSRQLTVALDVWIDRSELDAERTTFADSLRALCLHRARELYTERALLRLTLRRLNTGTRVAGGMPGR